MTDSFLQKVPIILFLTVPFFPLYIYFFAKPHFLWLSLPFFLYIIYRSLAFIYGLFQGYYLYRSEIKLDWFVKLKQATRKIPRHLIMIPVYKEDFFTLSRTIDSIINQNYNLEYVHIAVSIEERPDYLRIEKKLFSRYGKKLKNKLHIFCHVLGENEVKGAASNRTFGAKSFVNNYTRHGKSIDDFLITSPDADTVFHQNYLARTAYEWVVNARSKKLFMQTAVYKFANNYWKAPMLVRILCSNLTLAILSSSAADGNNRLTFSCFTLSLKTLVKADYWDSSIAVDDSPFYFRAFDKLNGKWSCNVFYIPISVDAINSPNYFSTHIKQYQQLFRWGYGIISFPLAIRSIINCNQSTIFKFYKLWKVFDFFILVKILPIIITLYFLLIGKLVSQIDAHNVFFTAARFNLVLIALIFYFKFKLISENSNMNKRRLSQLIIEIPFNALTLITYEIIPYIHAAAAIAIDKTTELKLKWSVKFNPEIKSVENAKIN